MKRRSMHSNNYESVDLDIVDAKDQHTKPKSTVRQAQTAAASNRGVHVNLKELISE